jgi:hypothetical protein
MSPRSTLVLRRVGLFPLREEVIYLLFLFFFLIRS